MSLDGRVAIVTGASRGIGADIARELARGGAHVIVAARTEQVTDPRLPGTIGEVAEGIRQAGGQATPLRMDMRDPESIYGGVQQVLDQLGRIDIIVNNAAVLVPGDIETVQDRHLDLMWQIDLRGPLLLCKAVVPQMKRQGSGHIINISSLIANFPGPGPYTSPSTGGLFYGMVKAGLERVTQGLAQDLQPHGISANVLSLDYVIKTPGNIFASNSREHPNLNFDSAEWMGRAARWIAEQPLEFTGHIVLDREIRDQLAQYA